MSKTYDNTMSGAVFHPRQTIDPFERKRLIKEGVFSGTFQLGKKPKTIRQCYARMKNSAGKQRNVVVLDKDGTVLHHADITKNKARGDSGPHFYAEFNDQRVAFFRKKLGNGDVYWQIVPSRGVDVGERPADPSTIV